MSLTRRHFLAASGAAILGRALGPSGRALASASSPKRPRYLVHLLLRGGIDAILTTDPKLRKQVEPGVDLPYEEKEILDLGSHRIGPFFASLSAEVPAMAIINAVDHGTVAHDHGVDNIAHMKRSYPIENELGFALAGRLGAELAETPLDDVWLVGTPTAMPTFMPARKGLVTQGWPGPDDTLVAKLWKTAETDAATVSKVLSQEIQACGQRPSNDCESLEVVRALVDKMHGTVLPAPPKISLQLTDQTNAWLAQKGASKWELMTRDAVFLLKNDLTRTIYFAVPHAFFDTHQNNLPSQRRNCQVFAEGLKVFFQAMREATTPDGISLYDQTAFVITSELGRNPFLNAAAGKDHFPHHPVILMGPGIQPGQYGNTDATMGGLPVSAETGKDDNARKRILPNLDDVGATICRWFSMDNVALGYPGRPLEFVFKS